MMRSKKGEQDLIAQAEAALRHPLLEKAEALIRLIREINPTERGLPGKDESLRYRLKSELQSVLIGRFSDELEVSSGDAPGVVSIRHRLLDAGACHARVSELTEEARSWVGRQLDLGGAEEESPSSALVLHRGTAASSAEVEEPGEPIEPLEAGQLALREYDFDRARICFDLAVKRDRTAPAPAQALLELLVDHLAADDEALALGRQFPRTVLQDPVIRLTLARAAGRSGNLSYSLRLLQGLELPEAAEVLLHCGHSLLEKGDAAQARGCWLRAKTLDPQLPGLASLDLALRGHDAAERVEAERELLMAFEAGDDGASEIRARQVLARWPRSELAAGWLRQRTERLAEERALELLQLFEEAKNCEALSAALVVLRAALATPLVPATLARVEAAIAAGSETLRTHESELRVDRARRLLVARDGSAVGRRDTFAAWLALDGGERLRAMTPDCPKELRVGLRWLELLGERWTRRLDVAIPLVDALVEAELYSESDPQKALHGLEPHSASLASCVDGIRLLHELRRRVIAVHREQAQKLLAEAEGAAGNADMSGAMALLQQPFPGEAEPAVRRAWNDLRERVRQELELQALQSKFEEHRTAEHWLEARDTLDNWIAIAPDSKKDGLRQERRPLVKRVYQSFSVLSGEGPLDSWWIGAFDTTPIYEAAHIWLRPGRDTLILPVFCDHWLFMFEWNWRTRTVIRWARMVVPEGMGIGRCCVDGERLTLVGDNGSFLELSLDEWEPQRWRAGVSTDEGVLIEHAVLSRDGRYLWINHRSRRDQEMIASTDVLDLQRGVRTRLGTGRLIPVIGSKEVALGLYNDGNSVIGFYDARGKSVYGSRPVEWLSTVATHPSGHGVIMLVEGDETSRTLVEVRPDGQLEHEVASHQEPSRLVLAVARESASLYLWQEMEESTCLDRWHWHDGHLERVARVDCEDCIAVCDADAQRVILLRRLEEGLRAAEPLQVTSSEDKFEGFGLLRPPHFSCNCSWDRPGELETEPTVEEVEQARQLREDTARWEPEIDDVEDAVSVLERSGHWRDAHAWRGELLERLNQHPHVRLRKAEELLRDGQDEAFIAALGQIAQEGISERFHQHFLHLKSWAAALEGDFEQASSLIAAAQKLVGGCDLLAEFAVACQPFATLDALVTDESIPEEERAVACYRQSLVQAEQAATVGDLRAAERCFDGWVSRYDDQAQARCVEAALRLEIRNSEDQLHVELVLAAFVAARIHRYHGIRFIAPELWSQERLDHLEQRAKAWLSDAALRSSLP